MLAEIATLVSTPESTNLASILSALCMLLTGVAAVVSAGGDNDKSPRKANKIAANAKKKPPKRVKTKAARIIFMSPEEWAAVPANPKQPRDHALRAYSPQAWHLYTFVAQLHERVKMAIDRRGNRWKINGHTRSEVWMNCLSDAVPARVTVEVINVEDAAEAAKRCIEYEDSRKAVNTPADLVHGALTYHNVSMTSNLMKRSSGLPAALSYAYEIFVAAMRDSNAPGHEQYPPARAATHEDKVIIFRDALSALDRLQPCRKKNGVPLFSGPLVTAFLLSYLKYGAKMLSFYEKLNDGNCGQKKGNRYDPIGHVEHLLVSKRGAIGARKDHLQLVSAILADLETYMSHPGFDARDENGKSTYQPKLECSKEMTVDLDVYLTSKRVKRTNRPTRNSLIKDKTKNR